MPYYPPPTGGSSGPISASEVLVDDGYGGKATVQQFYDADMQLWGLSQTEMANLKSRIEALENPPG